MKTIEQVKAEYNECPKGHSREHLSFGVEIVFCNKCDAHYDLGMKKFK